MFWYRYWTQSLIITRAKLHQFFAIGTFAFFKTQILLLKRVNISILKCQWMFVPAVIVSLIFSEQPKAPTLMCYASSANFNCCRRVCRKSRAFISYILWVLVFCNYTRTLWSPYIFNFLHRKIKGAMLFKLPFKVF